MAGAKATRRMGRPPLVDRDAIVRAALEIGFAKLTMSAVGQRLGASHSTLYRYFASRNALAAAAIDRAVDAVDWPEPGGDWRSYLSALASSYWDLYDTHPGLAAEVSSLRSTSRGMVAVTNRAAVALLGFGFSAAHAVLVQDMLGELVTQAFLGAPPPADGQPAEIDGPQAGADGRHTFSIVNGRRMRRAELIEPWLTLYDERIREEFSAAVARDPREQFRTKLTVLLDGIEALRRQPP
ncbi:TetR/AcrR family transcriptional regulator [Jiangella muralis]|uniref:TetR/AcrR family transcriptional regulator n=1 Tax=Jiangella muralis TaxID=702383 RepID=UPI00069D4C5F|nr:TetR/AcrR family transcriptional regulator [Jiangella muralis]